MDNKYVTRIKYSPLDNVVSMPLEVYSLLCEFCRRHGETDLPSFLEWATSIAPETSSDNDNLTFNLSDDDD